MTDIPQEWVRKAHMAFEVSLRDEGNSEPDSIQAALSAVIPLIREDERERLAKLAEADTGTPKECEEEGADWAHWLRAQRRE
jgi:hypothetical protein